MTPQTYSESPWLDKRKVSVDGMYYPVRIDKLLQHIASQPVKVAPRNLVFHTSHCCSTLLSRCFDALPTVMALKEPFTLRQLSELRRSQFFPDLESKGQWKQLIDLVMLLLSRTESPNVNSPIKLTSICQNLFEDIAYTQDARSIFLYSGLKEFMTSMYKQSSRINIYLDAYYPLLLQDMQILCPEVAEIESKMKTHEKLALMWVARVLYFLKFQKSCDIASLNSECFLRQPGDVMEKLCRHFNMPVDTDRINAIVTGPLFQQEAKWGARKYDAQSRRCEHQQILNEYGSAISAASEWAAQWLPQDAFLEELPCAI